MEVSVCGRRLVGVRKYGLSWRVGLVWVSGLKGVCLSFVFVYLVGFSGSMMVLCIYTQSMYTLGLLHVFSIFL